MSCTESIKPNLKLIIWVWEENTIGGPLISYPSAFTISMQPNFTQGFVLSDNKLNGIPLSPCGIKACQPLQEMTSCYLRTIPSLLLSSAIIYATMHGEPCLSTYLKRQEYSALQRKLAHCSLGWSTRSRNISITFSMLF